MGLYGNSPLCQSVSKALKAHMQGKACFNFNAHDAVLFRELEPLTAQALAGFRNAGYIK